VLANVGIKAKRAVIASLGQALALQKVNRQDQIRR
jgi:hypothetical protein